MSSFTRRDVVLAFGAALVLAMADSGRASNASAELRYRMGGHAFRFQDVPLQSGVPESVDRDRLLASFERSPGFLGWFGFGTSDASPITVARFDDSEKPGLYVDLNRDRVLSTDERASLMGSSGDDERDGGAWTWTIDVPLSAQQAESSPIHTLRFRIDQSTGGMFVAQAGHLSGHVDKSGRQVAARLFDTNCNGTFSNSRDRLHLDLNGDGRFSPLLEKFACRSVLRIDGERFTLGFSRDQRQVTLRPLAGTGFVIPVLALQNADADVTNFHAILVSDDGVHVPLNHLASSSELPVGAYRIEELQLKLRGDRVWTMNFSRSSSAKAEKVRITKGETARLDLLGTLTLESSIDGGDNSSGALTIQPSLTTSTGLFLTSSRVGNTKAQDDNELTASLMRLNPEGQREPLSVSGTGFQCGTFCPIVFSDQARIAQSSLVLLEFDSGPLAGPMIRVTVPPRLQSAVAPSAPEVEIP